MRCITLAAFAALYFTGCGGDDDAGPAPPDASVGLDGAARDECAAGEARDCPGAPGVMQRCVDGRWGACDAPPPGADESCDGADEDGDGAVDEGLVEPCGSATGACEPGLRICVDGAWSACAGAIEPRPESCDGTDEDCDGAVDEAPIMATTGSMPAPTTRPPSSIAWDGRAYAVAMPGYPNWILRLAVLDAYVWRADLVGRVPVDAIVASGPSGLVVTWAERDGSVVFGRLGWGDDGLPIEPVTLRGEGEGGRASGLRIAAETRTTLLGWLDDREGTAMPWVVPIDPETGTPRREPLRIAETMAARGLSLANNGEDGFALGWVTDEGAWFARLSNTMEVASGPWRVAEGATEVAVAGDYYVDTFIAVWTDGEAVHLGRIARDAEVIGSTERVAEGQSEVADVRFIRDDAKWGVFWTAAVEGGRVIRGRLYHRDGRTLSPVVDLGPVGEGAAVTFGIDGFTTATLTGGRLALRAGPIACPEE